MTIKEFKPEDIIIEQGQNAETAFMITSGKVLVFLKDNDKIVDLAELGPNEIFGETALFENGKYGAYVKALEETKVMVITPDILQNKIDVCDPMLKSIIEMLIKRLQNTNQSLLESETREFIDIGFI